MSKLKLKIAKQNRINPATKTMGHSARVLTNGTADFEDIAEDAAEETTFNKEEIQASSGIFCRKAAQRLKQGYIVDLGPLGKIYPSCTSGWFEKAEDLTMDSVKPTIYFRPSEDVLAAIRGASLVWAKPEDAEEAEQNGTVSPSGGDGQGTTPSGGGSDTGGSGGTTPGGDDNPDGIE